MKEIELQISQFIDNELNDAEQKKLFAVLAEDQNARQTLSDFIQLKNDTSEHYKNITTELFLPTTNLTSAETNKKYKMMFYLSLAASIVLAMLLGWNQNGKEEVLKQFDVLQTQYEILVNQYSDGTEKKNEKEPFPQQLAKKNIPTELRKKPSVKSISKSQNTTFLSRVKQKYETMPIKSVIITKEDFIGGQIVGN